jgi:multiple sugar transport system substrate-binding protein
LLPPIRTLVEQPFWLDPSDRHRMHAAVQILTRPHFDLTLGVRDKEWRSPRISEENVWGRAVHRVAAEGISPERAVDEAIARIKQILAE